jgi:hypothetical protein
LCPLQVSNGLVVITGVSTTASTVTSTSTLACSGTPITLSSTSQPSATYGLQWYKDGTAISGATLATYTTAVAGAYTVRRIHNTSGCAGAVSNSIAVTTGLTPSSTTIGSQTGSTVLCSSTTNSVVLVSSSAPSATYGLQWYNGSTAISGATSQTYTATTAGSYSIRRVHLTSGCMSSASSAIAIGVGNIPASSTATLSGTSTVICGASSITLQSSSLPSTSYNLKWYKDGVALSGSNTATYIAQTAGSYRVQRIPVSATLCPSQMSNAITLTQGTIPAAPVVSVQSGTLTTCAGTPVVLSSSVAPGSGTTIQWFKASTAISSATAQTYSAATAGIYRVKATSGGCTSPYSNNLTVTVASLPGAASISVSSGSLTLCNGSTVTFTSASTVTSTSGIRWYKDGVQIAGATSQSYTASTPGVYTARRINSTGCLGAASSAMTVISCNPIVVNDNNGEQEDATSKLNTELTWDAAVSRNPYDQYVTIRLNTASDSDVELTMIDAMGKVVSTDNANMKELGSMHIGEGLTPGIYLIQVRQDENIKTIRVIKQ